MTRVTPHFFPSAPLDHGGLKFNVAAWWRLLFFCVEKVRAFHFCQTARGEEAAAAQHLHPLLRARGGARVVLRWGGWGGGGEGCWRGAEKQEEKYSTSGISAHTAGCTCALVRAPAGELGMASPRRRPTYVVAARWGGSPWVFFFFQGTWGGGCPAPGRRGHPRRQSRGDPRGVRTAKANGGGGNGLEGLPT